MTTRADVNRLADTNRRIVELAKADLLDLMGAMDLSTPEAVRDALLEIVPELVREYGDVAAAAAAEWYSDLRAASGIPGRHVTALSDGADLDAVTGSVRSLAGGLWGDDPLGVASALGAALQRYITYSSRDTVRRNAAKDPQRARYARVPTGVVTCAFCEMTASRGFVYHSKQQAGDGNDYHDDCVVAGTIVSGPAAVAATSRYYEGEVITLRAGGHDVTVTPNHPVLTGRGWVRAQFVNELDDLFVAESVERVVGSGPDKHEGPARVEDRFAALLVEPESTRRRMPGAPEQFHGDGFDSEVDVVTRNHLLRDEVDALAGERAPEFDFPSGSRPCASLGGALPPEGSAELGEVGLGGPTDGLMGGGGLCSPLLCGQEAGAVLACGASVADRDAGFGEPASDGAPRYAFSIGDGVLTFPGQIPARDVIRALNPVSARVQVGGVSRGWYSGHVYNLSTATHWYLANSIVTHNCNCQVVVEWDAAPAHIQGYDPDVMYSRYQAARNSANSGDPNEIAAAMRRLYPDQYTDGVKP